MASDLQNLQKSWIWRRRQIIGTVSILKGFADMQLNEKLKEDLTEICSKLVVGHDNYFRKKGVNIKEKGGE